MKMPLAALGAAVVLLVLAGCPGGAPAGAPTPYEVSRQSTLHKVLDKKKLVVGLEAKFVPFEYDDGSGKPKGFDVDLVALLAEALGVALEVRDINFDGLIPSLLDGKVDIICSGMTATLERARTVSFSEPYFRTGLCLLVNRARGAAIAGAQSLDREDVVLVVKTGTTGHIVAEKRFPKARKRVFRDEGACALEVAQGRADAFVYDQFSIAKHARAYPDTTRAILEPFTHEPYAIATRQGEADLLRYIDQFLRTIRDDGRLAELERRHLGELFGR